MRKNEKGVWEPFYFRNRFFTEFYRCISCGDIINSMIFHSGYYDKHSPRCAEYSCNCGLHFRGARSFQDCCGECDVRLECLDSPVPAIQAIAMVEVTDEMRECSLHPWDQGYHNHFKYFYGNLIANTKEDIGGIHGDY